LPRFSCAHLKVFGLSLGQEKVNLTTGAVHWFVTVVMLRAAKGQGASLLRDPGARCSASSLKNCFHLEYCFVFYWFHLCLQV
jgi:hypothetical protein